MVKEAENYDDWIDFKYYEIDEPKTVSLLIPY